MDIRAGKLTPTFKTNSATSSSRPRYPGRITCAVDPSCPRPSSPRRHRHLPRHPSSRLPPLRRSISAPWPAAPPEPHRVPPTGGEPAVGLGILLAEAEVDGGTACPIGSCGVEAVEDHALAAEEGSVTLDDGIDYLEVLGRELARASHHRQLVQPPGLGRRRGRSPLL